MPKLHYPALLPPNWKRFNKDYEDFLLACLVNGYSKAKDAYHTELREEGKMQSISIYVAIEIDLDKYKQIL